MCDSSSTRDDIRPLAGDPPSPYAVAVELKQAAEIAKNARGTFFGILIACAYSCLTIFTTRDSHLLANSTFSKLPVIGAEVPIAWFYSIGPLLLVSAFLYFHLYLQGLWRCLGRAIAGARDLSGLDDHVFPWMISSSLVRFELAKRRNLRRPLMHLERYLSLFFGWGFVPLIVVVFWIRYLVRHDWLVTSMHIVLISICCFAGVGFFRLANQTLSGAVQDSTWWLERWSIGATRPAIVVCVLATITVGLVSAGAILGAPADHCRTFKGSPECNLLLSGVRILETTGLGPFATIENVELSRRPSDWDDSGDGYIASIGKVEPAQMNHRDIRYGRASGAFLAAADLSHSDLSFIDLSFASLQGARLSHANLMGAHLKGISMQSAELDNTQLTGADLYESNLTRANLNAVRLEGADLVSARLDEATGASALLEYADLRKADLKDVMLLETSFYRAQLMRASLTGSTLENSDFSEAEVTSSQVVYEGHCIDS